MPSSGLAGERIVNYYKSYTVFHENVEYTVRSGSEQLGTIVKPPPVGDKIAIAGRVWFVDEVDHKRHEMFCTLVKGNIPAYFGDVAGDIHTHILRQAIPLPHIHAILQVPYERISLVHSGEKM